MTFQHRIFFLVVFFWSLPTVAGAIPAPELVTSFLTQGLQLIGLVFALLASAFTGIMVRLKQWKQMTWMYVLGMVIFLFVSVGIGVWYIMSRPTASPQVVQNATSTPMVQGTELEAYAEYKAKEEALRRDLEAESRESTQEIAKIYGITYVTSSQDASTQFVLNYYKALDEKRMGRALAITGATKSETELLNWYQDVYQVHIFMLESISQNDRKVLVGLREKNALELYSVVQRVVMEEGEPIRLQLISSQHQKTLAMPTLQTEALTISNEQFQQWITEKKDMVVLDAREDLEYDYGHFPGSLHVRQPDVLADPGTYLPKEKPIVVFCFTGGRGSEVAYALRKKGYNAFALVDGVKGWVEDFHGTWEGKHLFWQTYPRFAGIRFYGDFEKAISDESVYVIDASDATHPRLTHPRISQRIDLFASQKNIVESELQKIPKDRPIATVCQEYVDCFAAKLIAQTLVNRGYTVRGAYDIR